MAGPHGFEERPSEASGQPGNTTPSGVAPRDIVRQQLRGATYAQGAAMLAPVQMAPNDGQPAGTDWKGGGGTSGGGGARGPDVRVQQPGWKGGAGSSGGGGASSSWSDEPDNEGQHPGPIAENKKVVFPKQRMTPVSVGKQARAPIFEKTIGVGPAAVTVEVAAIAEVLGHITAEVGEGTLSDITTDASGKGSASLHVPANVGAALNLTGRLEVDSRLFGVFPAAKVSGALNGHANGSAVADSTVRVSVRRTEAGNYELEGSGEFGAELTGDVGLSAQLAIDLLSKQIWSAEWQVASCAWSSGEVFSGAWKAKVGDGAPVVGITPGATDVQAQALLDRAFDLASVAQRDGEDNPWNCRADGQDVVGDFKDFPWDGVAGAPAYPTKAVRTHPANEHYGYVTDAAVPQPSGPYRIVAGQWTDGAPDKSDGWRAELNRQKNEYKEALETKHPNWTKDRVEKAAKKNLEDDYGMDWPELYCVRGTFSCHHIQEVSWGGAATAASNLKYLDEKQDHGPYTAWATSHRAAMRRYLGIKL